MHLGRGVDINNLDTLERWRGVDQSSSPSSSRRSRAEKSTTLRRVHELGYRDVSLTDTNLLANLDTEGTTISARN